MFVEHYINGKMRNAAAAYRHAYPGSKAWNAASVGNEAHQLLKHPRIYPIIEKLRAEQSATIIKTMRNYSISKERIIERLAHHALSDVRDVMSWDRKGNVTFVPSSELSDATAAAIAEIRVTKTGLIIKMADQQTALMNLAKLHDLLKVEMVVKGDKDDPIVIEHRLAARKTLIDALERMAIPEPLTIEHE